MEFLNKIRNWFANLSRPAALHDDLAEEVEHHLSMTIERKIADGMNPEDARKQAVKEFGAVERLKEECQDAWGTRVFENCMRDSRLAFRTYWNDKGFSVVALLTLALGIGATAAIFSVTNAVLLQPLPYPDSNRLIELMDGGGSVAIPNFEDWKEQQSVFEHLGLYKEVGYTLTGSFDPIRIDGALVSRDVLAALAVRPEIGRTFSEEEDAPGGPPVVLLSYGLWQGQFDGKRDILNQTIQIDGSSHVVTGVLPADFQLIPKAKLFLPVEQGIEDGDRQNRNNQSSYRVLAKLKQGISFDQAKAEMAVISNRLTELYPQSNKDRPIRLVPLVELKVRGVKQTLWIVFGAVALVLVIACINVANLLVVRAFIRRREMAIRSAMGATSGDIIGKLLIESIILAISASVLGLLFAYGGLPFLIRVAAQIIPRASEIGIDGTVFVFTAAVALGTGALFGLAPAFAASRNALAGVLKESSRGSTSGRSRIFQCMVVGEISLTFVLLVASGLLLQTIINLQGVDAGFDHEGVLSFRVDLPESKYADANAIDQFSIELLRRLRSIPGVQLASLGTQFPLDDRGWGTPVLIEGRPVPHRSEQIPIEINMIDSDYFETLGIPLISGRWFNARDTYPANLEKREELPNWAGLNVIIVDEQFVRRHFPGEDPIGKQVRFPWGEIRDEQPVMTIVGVAGDVKQNKLREDDTQVWVKGYMPFAQRPIPYMAFILKSRLASGDLLPVIRQNLSSIDSQLPIYDIRSLSEVRSANISSERMSMILIVGSAAIALSLSVIGVYGILAYSVTQRRREIGVRLALGARRRRVVNLLLRQGVVLALIGIAVGFIGAFSVNRVLSNLLYSIVPNDPLTYLIVSGVLIFAVIMACAIPALRASRISPLEALQSD